MLSNRLPVIAEANYLIASRKPSPSSEGREMRKATKSTCGNRSGLSGILHIGRCDDRGRGRDANVRYPTEGSYLEPVYSAG